MNRGKKKDEFLTPTGNALRRQSSRQTRATGVFPGG